MPGVCPGEGRGVAPPLFLAQTAFFGDCPPLSQDLDDPPPPHVKVWIYHWEIHLRLQPTINDVLPLAE